jgi:hypothetical protein
MKKQAADQGFHDRRHQERMRAEAAKRAGKKQNAGVGKPKGPAAGAGK